MASGLSGAGAVRLLDALFGRSIMVDKQLRVVLIVGLLFGSVTSILAQEKVTISALEKFARGAEKTEPEKAPPVKKAEPGKRVAVPAAKATSAELAKMLSRAEALLNKGNFAPAREVALKIDDQRAGLAAADQARLDKVLWGVDRGLKARDEGILDRVSKEFAATKGPTERMSDAERTLAKYTKLNKIKIEKDKAMAQDYIKAGVAMTYNERDYDQAIEFFKKAIVLDPNAQGAKDGIKQAKFLKGDKGAVEAARYEQWIPEADVRLQAAKQKLRVAISKGNQLYADKEYEDALKEYRRAQTFIPFLETQTDVSKEQQELDAAIAQAGAAYKEYQKELAVIQEKETRAKLKQNLEQKRKEQFRKKAEMVDQVIELVQSKRFQEAHNLAKEMDYQDPADPTAGILMDDIARTRHPYEMARYKRKSELELLKVISETHKKAIPYSDPVVFPELKVWNEIIDVRKPVSYPTLERAHSEEEKAVYASLDKPVEIDFADTPLPDVVSFIRDVRGINIALDRTALAEDLNPVTLKMKDVPLARALREILDPFEMGYAVEGNVVRIAKKSKLEKYELRVYDVRDLLLNFEDADSGTGDLTLGSTSSNNGSSGNSSSGNNGNDDDDDGGESISSRVESLALLISQTVRPETWQRVGVIGGPSENNWNDGDDDGGFGGDDEFGFGQEDEFGFEEGGEGVAQQGRGRILSRGGNPGDMIVLQTPEVHAEIEELLKALRRSMNIQVQIDARFLTVSDTWLKDVGFEFSSFTSSQDAFTVDASGNVVQRAQTAIFSPSVGTPGPTLDADGNIGIGLGDSLNIPFIGSGTIPNEPFGLNVFFSVFDDFGFTGYLKAIQSTDQSQVLAAPRVTLTNAQQGYITVGTQTNYVASFSAEGDIATPDIQTIDDSVSLDVRPIVSADRKYVFLELQPRITTVIDIQTFDFGSQVQSDGDSQGLATTTRIQLPVQAQETVETTVMVPDRGVLTIGGLTTLSETQIQRGVPVLSKIPILKRLFSNDRKSRSRRNLMILVRPRIIIMEEEKESQL